MKQRIDTRKDEVRYITSDPKKMINKYIVSTVLKTWTEDFIDEDTGEVVSIERNEVLFPRGTFIDPDVLARIQFSMQADGIKEVEVSNQKRMAFENKNTHLFPWTVVAEIGDKKYKFLMYASSMMNMLDIMNDYIELNFTYGYTIVQAKEMDSCIILTDNLRKTDGDLEKEYINGDMSLDEYADAKEDEQQAAEVVKKFYGLDVKITMSDETEITQSFIVHTVDTDRAMMIISQYIRKAESETKKRLAEKGQDYVIRDFKLCIEKAAPIPAVAFVPKEFSMVYNESK